MSDLDALFAALPIDQIAAQLGEDPEAVRQAAGVALPALLGGLQANAQDPSGEASLFSALAQHQNDLATPPIDVTQVDTEDGAKIARHVFGDQQEQVVNQLGGLGGGSGLVAKLLPILAPIVLSYLAKQLSSSAGSGGGILGQILSQVLSGAAQGAGGSTRSSGLGSLFEDVLGGLLGGGRRS